MSNIIRKLGLVAVAMMLSASVAVAQAPAPAPGAGTPGASTKAPAPPAKARRQASTPEGIECSAQADSKALKGKERRRFRSKCIAGLKKAKPKAESAKKGSG